MSGAIGSIEARSYFQARRWSVTAATWFRKTAAALSYDHKQAKSDNIRYLLAVDTARLLTDVLYEARQLVPVLLSGDGDELGHAEREAEALVRALRNERRAAKLDNTAGRTAEEAQAFRAKAAELRDGRG